jgi:hypothetical protein
MKTRGSLTDCTILKKDIIENGEQMLTSIKKYQREHAETCYERIKFIKENKISSNPLLNDKMIEYLIQLCDFYLKQCPKKFLPNGCQKAEYQTLKNSITDVGELMLTYIKKYQKVDIEACYESIEFIKENKLTSNPLLNDKMIEYLIQLCDFYLKQCPKKFLPNIRLNKKIQLRNKNKNKDDNKVTTKLKLN